MWKICRNYKGKRCNFSCISLQLSVSLFWRIVLGQSCQLQLNISSFFFSFKVWELESILISYSHRHFLLVFAPTYILFTRPLGVFTGSCRLFHIFISARNSVLVSRAKLWHALCKMAQTRCLLSKQAFNTITLFLSLLLSFQTSPF